MKFKVTMELDGLSANQVASKIMSALYYGDIDADTLDVELIRMAPEDIEFLAEVSGTHDAEVFHFPRTQELINYLNGPLD